MRPALRKRELLPVDLALFEKPLFEVLKGLFPFETLDLVHVSGAQALDRLFDRIGLSQRQKERAHAHLEDGAPFWDRITNQALIPLGDRKDHEFFICRVFGMPKNIGAEEGRWFLALAQKVLSSAMLDAKERALFSGNDKVIPQYLHLLLSSGQGPLDVIELSIYAGDPLHDICYLMDVLRHLFFEKEVLFCGRAGGSLWFSMGGLSRKQIEACFKKVPAGLKKKGISVKRFALYESAGHAKDILSYRELACGLRAGIFSSGMLEALLAECGLDEGIHDILSLSKSNVSSSSVGAILSFSEGSRRDKAASRFDGWDHVTRIGERGLFALFSNTGSRAGGEIHELENLLSDHFLALKKEVDSQVICGLASPMQPFVTRQNLVFSSFLACYHARLLGPGNLAFFDHVTCNVHGDVLFSWGDLSGATACYRKGLRLKEDDVNLLNSLGACLADVSRYSKAKAFFERVLEVEPKNVMALYNLSSIYLGLKKVQKARELAQRALDENPADVVLQKRLLEILIMEGAWPEAYKLSRRVLSGSSLHSPAILRLCAHAALESGNWHEAKELAKTCLKKSPEDPAAILLLARGFLDFENDRATSGRLLKRFKDKRLGDRSLETERKRLLKRIYGKMS